MTNTTVDWGRAVVMGAVAGGVFWALAAFAITASDGSPVTIVAVGAGGIVAIAVGVIAHHVSSNKRGRSFAVVAIIAPLTGAVTIVTFSLGALLMQIVS